MMQPVLFKVKLFRDPADRARSQQALLWMLEALCKVNEGHLADRPYPPLYEAGVRYQREEGTEQWLDIPSVLEAGWGDCEDLACWRVAELRRQRRAGLRAPGTKLAGADAQGLGRVVVSRLIESIGCLRELLRVATAADGSQELLRV